MNLPQPLRRLTAVTHQLDISSDFKALLSDLAKVTWHVGSTVVALGRKILSVAVDIFTAFPRTSSGVVVAYIVTLIVGTIPLVGLLLAAFVGPIILATGHTMGHCPISALPRGQTELWRFRRNYLSSRSENW